VFCVHALPSVRHAPFSDVHVPAVQIPLQQLAPPLQD